MKWISVLALAISATADEPVRIESGFISGVEERGIRAYKGIPYAAPPVGEGRWRAPEPPEPWAGVRAATEFGPACYQPLKANAYGPSKIQKISEDCLYLNIWTPRTENAPVMVWIHGGGHTDGAGSLPTYNGENLARRGAIVVTINYRLGPFGYMAHPALSEESDRNVSGNYGALDQIAALKWVKRNIAAFGGDPGRVTLFGESAGAVSTGLLMVSPAAAGLFHRVILQSGVPANVTTTVRQWERVGERIGEQLGCKTAECLRAKSSADILKAANPVGILEPGNKFLPVVDGWLVPEPPMRRIAAGEIHKVDLMIGANADEGGILMVAVLPEVNNPGAYKEYLRKTYGKRSDEVLALYPPVNVRDALGALRGDSAFVAPARRVARQATAAGNTVYLYHFSRVRGDLGRRFGAYHGAEIPFVFGTAVTGVTPLDKTLSEFMMGAWVRFADSGDPNGARLPHWPAYDAKRDEFLEFGDEIRVRTRLRKEACDLFDRLAER